MGTTFVAGRFASRTARVMASAGLGMLLIISAARGQEVGSIEALGWLAGCWEGALPGGSRYEEIWMTPRGGVMLGMSRTLREERAVGHEFLRIAEVDGALVYLADPSDQAPTSFQATEVGDTAVTFANPEHDFPQRILYRLDAPDSLSARIEGQREGQIHGVDFPLHRTRCPQ